MPSPKKNRTIENLSESIQKAKTIIFTDYRSLDVSQMESLRKKLEEKEAKYIVIKNTLFKIACQKNNIPCEKQEKMFEGPTAITLCFEDEIEPLKTLFDFAKNNQLPQIKGIYFDQQFFDSQKTKVLATLPNKTILIGQLANIFASPLRNFMSVGKYHPQLFINLLSQIKDKKENLN